MSPVPMLPATLGTIEFSLQLAPPSLDRKMGASTPPAGSGVNAVPTSCLLLVGLIVRCGSLSCVCSLLSDFGIMLIRKTPAGAAADVRVRRAAVRRVVVRVARFDVRRRATDEDDAPEDADRFLAISTFSTRAARTTCPPSRR